MTVRSLELDLSKNRLGACWMFLTALATAAAIRPEPAVDCVVPPALRSLAEKAFNGRITFIEKASPDALVWSHFGLRGMLPGVLRGRRYVAPYPRIVAHVRRLKGLKNRINLTLLAAFNHGDRICLPPWSSLEHYIGFIQLTAVPQFRSLSWEEFLKQFEADFPIYRERIIAAI